MFYTYILFSEKLNQFYKGSTGNLQDRIIRHNNGYEKATKRGIPWKLVWYTEKPDRSQAQMLEYKLKNLSRVRTIEFIQKYQKMDSGDTDVQFLLKSGC